MEIVVTLTDKNLLDRLAERRIDGIIFGGIFSNKYNYSLEDMEEINDYCRVIGIKRYISIDTFILEENVQTLAEYISFLKGLNPDGVFFTDLAVLNCCKNLNLDSKLIYDPQTLLTNSYDIGFYLARGIDVVLSRELTLEEIMNIVKKYPYKLDMQVFGHLKMSYSRRRILRNYFSEILKPHDVLNKTNLTLVEETRNYKMPVKETKYGTCIYTDYVFEMYEEYAYLKKLLKRCIVDTEFIDDETVIDVIRDLKRITTDNSTFLKDSFVNRNSKYTFTKGYLYQKTTDKKENDEQD